MVGEQNVAILHTQPWAISKFSGVRGIIKFIDQFTDPFVTKEGGAVCSGGFIISPLFYLLKAKMLKKTYRR